MRATKLVISIKNLTYKDRLKRLKLPTLKYRRITGDMIEVYKILTNKYDSRVNLYLEKQQDNITRGHSLKLVNNRYHYDLRKFSFAPRIVNVWNSLPEIVISAATTDTFKRRLDKFWQHQDILHRLLSVQMSQTPGLYAGPGVYPGPGLYHNMSSLCYFIQKKTVNFHVYRIPVFCLFSY